MLELENLEQLKEGITLVEIYTENCNACKKQLQILDKIEPDYKGMTFYKSDSFNVETGTKLINQYNLMSAPSILIYKDGNLIEQLGGLIVPNKLKGILEGIK